MQIYTTGPETPRLKLRALTEEDAEDVFALNSHPDVMKYTGEPPFRSLEDAVERIRTYPDFEERGFGRWGCLHKADQRVIGFCGLKYLSELDAVDLGYRLLPQYWGQGLATEAALATVAFGFDVLKLSEIIGLVMPGNVASIRVLEKVGMQPQGEILYDGDMALKYAVGRG